MSFELGTLVQTAGVSAKSSENPNFAGFVLTSLRRHAAQDWGDLGQEDKDTNDEALREGYRLFSAYQDHKTNTKIWIITECDRSVTTVLFPEEY